MTILNMISNKFSIDVKYPPATIEEIVKLKNFSPISLPKEYCDIALEATDLEIKVNDFMYIRIWSPLRCIDMNEAYEIQKYIPNSLAIGDDEGGTAMMYVKVNDTIKLYFCNFDVLDINEIELIAPSLKDLLVNNIGIDVAMRGYV